MPKPRKQWLFFATACFGCFRQVRNMMNIQLSTLAGARKIFKFPIVFYSRKCHLWIQPIVIERAKEGQEKCEIRVNHKKKVNGQFKLLTPIPVAFSLSFEFYEGLMVKGVCYTLCTEVEPKRLLFIDFTCYLAIVFIAQPFLNLNWALTMANARLHCWYTICIFSFPILFFLL